MQTKKVRVLIFPAGSEIAIEIFDALKFQKDIELYGATSARDHSEFLFRRLFLDMPYINEDGFVEALNEIIDENQIDYIYPALDSVQLFLMRHQDRIRSRIVSSDLETVEICRSKAKTYKHLENVSFLPKLFTPDDEITFPIFGKPSIGEASKGAMLIKSQHDLQRCIDTGEEYVFCEYLPGEELTVDCFTDIEGRLKVCKPRVRDRVKAGISVRSHSVSNNGEIEEIAQALNEKFSFSGAWFFQIKQRESGEYILMEVSPRIPGTMGLSRNTGINFPLLTLYNFEGIRTDLIDLHFSSTLDKAFISRFDLAIEYDTVYIDFDDTIVCEGLVNSTAVQFLYQCVNSGKTAILLTRHTGDIHEALHSARLAENLFDSIIHIDETSSKADYISSKTAIFIDDSFKERQQVFDTCGIPVFDPSNLEALLDWRM